MKIHTNLFGTGELYNEQDLNGSIYCKCCACMSVSSDFLSWANFFVEENSKKISSSAEDADNIIILSCQVTDLAILNDLNNLNVLMAKYPSSSKNFFVGGCLAKRFDIELPINVKRLDSIRKDRQPINNMQLLDYASPFWVKDFKEDDGEYAQGHLFRKMYPLRIGVGCKNKCKYCTIRETRDEFYEIKPSEDTIKEFLDNADKGIVLIADNPSPDLLTSWLNVSKKYSVQVSLRNVEPSTVVKIFPLLKEMSDKKLLKILHSPVQSTNPSILKDMGRNVKDTQEFLKLVPSLKNNTFIATNVIIDYKHFSNIVIRELEVFDYVSWNPYWDGVFNKVRANKRWKHYLF